MSSYKEFKAQAKRRKAKRVAGRIFLIILIAALLIAAGYVAIVVFFDGDLFGYFKNLENNNVSSQSQPIDDSQADSEPEIPAVAITNTNWNTVLPVQQTVNLNMALTPDYRLLAVPKSGRVTEEYFKSALFIGDSLTQGIGMYEKSLNNGRTNVCAYIGANPKTITENSSAKKSSKVYVKPHDEIFAVQPNNIYILMGTNTIVSAITDEGFIAQYAEMLDFLKANFHPNVQFYVQGMPPVTAETAAERPKMNNDRIRALNNSIAQIAVARGMYFIDLQEALAGDDGNLPVEIASKADGYHLTPDGYAQWVDYLKTHTVYNPMHAALYEELPTAG